MSLVDVHSLLLLIAAVFSTLLVGVLARNDPLSNIPGPWLARYTSLLLAFHARGGKRYLYIDKLHKKYGPLVRITPAQVSCCHPDAPAVVYAQGSSALPKTPFYKAFYVDGSPSLFSTQDRQGHASRRRALAHPFSHSSVRQLEGWIRQALGKLTTNFDGLCSGPGLGAETPGRAQGSGPFVDILAWFNFMTFDVISDLAFGEPLGMIDRGSDRLTLDDKLGVAAMIDYRGRTAAFLGLFPALLAPSPAASFIMWFLRRVLPDPFIRRGLSSTEALSAIARRCVKRRLEGTSYLSRGDLLDKILESQAKTQPGIDENDVVTEAMLLLTAGSDTTANSSAAILFQIVRTPRVYRKLMNELARLDIRRGSDGYVLPTYDQVKDLRYLQATIDETLRRFATNAFGLPRIVPENVQVELCGVTFPAGTQLSVPAWSIQHDEALWGDPMICRPERWIENPALKKYLLTFGLGPRACIGKNLAYMQIQLLIATVLSRYHFELRDEVLQSVEGFMHKPVDMWARISRRDQ